MALSFAGTLTLNLADLAVLMGVGVGTTSAATATNLGIPSTVQSTPFVPSGAGQAIFLGTASPLRDLPVMLNYPVLSGTAGTANTEVITMQLATNAAFAAAYPNAPLPNARTGYNARRLAFILDRLQNFASNRFSATPVVENPAV